MKYFMAGILLGAIPMILGAPLATRQKTGYRVAYAYCIGFFIQIALFEIPIIPIVLSYGAFRTLKTVYSVLLMSAVVLSVLYLALKRKGRLPREAGRLNWSEWVYLALFLGVLFIQLARCVTRDISYMSYDDAGYLAFSSDAILENGLGTINAYTGEYIGYNSKYCITAWLYYPAYLSSVTGISVPTVAHTVFRAQLTVLSYASFWCLACEMFRRQESRWMCMLMVSLLYWFGYHSHYSLTFRMLGPNYQGKAVVATVMTPLLYAILIHVFRGGDSRVNAFSIIVLSIASGALTMWGAGTMVLVTGIAVGLSLLPRKRRWRSLKYLCYSSAIPALYFLFFFYMRRAV